MNIAGEAAASCRLDGDTQCMDPDVQAREDARLLLAMIDVGPLAKSSRHEILYRYAAAHEALQRRWEAIDCDQRRRNENFNAMKADVERERAAVDYWQRADAVEALKHVLDGKKARSVKTPFGLVGFRKTAERLTVVDPEAVPADWVESIRLETKVVTTLDKKGMAAHYRATGEVLPGCDVVSEQDEFYCR